MPLQNTNELFIKETDILDTGSFEHETFCDQLSKAFQEPSLEVLAVLQIFLPLFYHFLVPVLAECFFNLAPYEGAEDMRLRQRKVMTVVLSSSAHWYIHWETFGMFWLGLFMTHMSHCLVSLDMPAEKIRFYEFSVSMGLIGIVVSYVSNAFSKYRTSLPDGYRHVFNVSAFFLSSRILRIVFPCIFQQGLMSEVELNGIENLPPPSYDDLEPPPPTYEEAIVRLRSRLSKSIFLKSQMIGRIMVIRRNAVAAEAGPVGQIDNNPVPGQQLAAPSPIRPFSQIRELHSAPSISDIELENPHVPPNIPMSASNILV